VKQGTMTREDKERQVYHRRVVKSGGARTLSVGKILPADWLIVKIKVIEFNEEEYVLKISKLD